MDVGINKVAVGAAVGMGVAVAQADNKMEISPVSRTRRFILPPWKYKAHHL
jgi:hypothetical protein